MTSLVSQPVSGKSTILSKDDLKALRTADEVHARHTDKQSQLEAIQHNRKSDDVFSGTGEGRRVIPTRAALVHYRKDTSVDRDRDPYCWAFSIGARFREEWETIVGLLRVGDELELEWISADNNGYMEAAHGVYSEHRYHFQGLYHDRVRLRVFRKGQRKYLFHLHDVVCPDNSARMIRKGGEV